MSFEPVIRNSCPECGSVNIIKRRDEKKISYGVIPANFVCRRCNLIFTNPIKVFTGFMAVEQ